MYERGSPAKEIGIARMIVQIYEIQEPRQAEQCIASGVDHIGSVLVSEDGWRQPSVKEAILLSEGTEAKNSLMPLFEDVDTLGRCIEYYRPDYLHFCGNLTDHSGQPINLERIVQFQCTLKEQFPEIDVIRSIPIPIPGKAQGFPALQIARTMEPVSDLFLIDTWVEEEPIRGYIGITGRPADWDLSRELVRQSAIPVIVAGGLSPQNVFEALMRVCPYGADSCTHTNRVDRNGKATRFQKDFNKVRDFVHEVRRAGKAIRDRVEGLRGRLEALERELREREAALPAHSLRPQQIWAIESLEEEIAFIRRELGGFGGAFLDDFDGGDDFSS
jgi:phosphoribosylanthranilate isomerase